MAWTYLKKARKKPARRITYKNALEEIYSLDRFGSHPGLVRISRLLLLLGNPQLDYKCIIVGGSNGKGSSTEMIGTVLRAEGWRVGAYFSPQIVEFPERIRVNGKNASRKEIAFAYARVKSACRENGIRATFFEAVTAMALLIFAMKKVDYAVLEVGLGGRHDATNAVEPEVSAITSISLEHTEVLGKKIPAIAHQKCGIARRGRKLICGMLNEEGKAAVRNECSGIGAAALFVDDEVLVHDIEEKNGCYSFAAKYRGEHYSVRLRVPGRFQISNACVSLAVCREIGAGRLAIEDGLASARPKFRMEKMGASPLVIADCCHNPEAAFAISSEIYRMKNEPKVLLFAAMKDKDYESVLRTLRPHFGQVVICRVSLPRAAKITELARAARKADIEAVALKNPKSALEAAKKLAGSGGLVFIAGSIYLLEQLFGKDKRLIGQ